MPACPVCQFDNQPTANVCQICNTPLGTSSTAPPDAASMDAETYLGQAAARKRRNRLLWAAAILVGAGAIAAYVLSAKRHQEEIRVHDQALRAFNKVDTDQVAEFWRCVLMDPRASVRQLMDTESLYAGVQRAYLRNPAAYAKFIEKRCETKLEPVPAAISGLAMPDEYRPLLGAYLATIKAAASATDGYVESLRRHAAQWERDKKVAAAAAIWHQTAYGGSAKEAVAYDQLMRCALPGFATFKDGQALVVALFSSCKHKTFVARVRSQCMSVLEAAAATRPASDFRAVLRRMGEDDRDISAWTDCFRKADKDAWRDGLSALGQAWADYIRARQAVVAKAVSHLKR